MCLFCSSTLNIVFGKASLTMPSTSIASSLATIPPKKYSKKMQNMFAFFLFHIYNFMSKCNLCQHGRMIYGKRFYNKDERNFN